MTAPVCIAPEEIENERIPIFVWNISDKPIRVYREQSAATVEQLPNKIGSISTTTENKATTSIGYDPMPEIQIGEELNNTEATRLKDLIWKNTDIQCI